MDPKKLLNSLSLVLTPTGGIKSSDKVSFVVSLMTKYSKKLLVSKCVFVQVLKATTTDLLEQFLNEKGWDLLNVWLATSVRVKNMAFCKEMLSLLLLCPVSAALLKDNVEENSAPRHVEELRKNESRAIRKLATRVHEKWLTVASRENSETNAGPSKSSKRHRDDERDLIKDEERDRKRFRPHHRDEVGPEERQRIKETARKLKAELDKTSATSARRLKISKKPEVDNNNKSFSFEEILSNMDSVKRESDSKKKKNNLSFEETMNKMNSSKRESDHRGRKREARKKEETKKDLPSSQSDEVQANSEVAVSPRQESLAVPREVRGILVLHQGSEKRSRTVSWRPDTHLTSVLYFKVAAGERVNVNKIKFERMKQMELDLEKTAMKSKNVMGEESHEARQWRSPRPFPFAAQSDFAAGAASTEKEAQAVRESAILQEIYFSRDTTPATPAEPNPEEGLANSYAVIVPIEPSGVDTEVLDHRAFGWSEPKTSDVDHIIADQAGALSLPPSLVALLNRMGGSVPQASLSREDSATLAAQMEAMRVLGMLPADVAFTPPSSPAQLPERMPAAAAAGSASMAGQNFGGHFTSSTSSVPTPRGMPAGADYMAPSNLGGNFRPLPPSGGLGGLGGLGGQQAQDFGGEPTIGFGNRGAHSGQNDGR
jgi:hypothetical protein